MNNPLKQIVKFNEQAGLLTTPCPKKEAAYQIEEALEGFNTSKLSLLLSPSEPLLSPKDISRKIMNIATWEGIPEISEVDQLDKACDAVVFAVGHMAKLGLSAQQITAALNIVMSANLAKVNCPKDAEGKLTKPADFEEKYAPEPKLQALLDKRNQ